MRRYAWHDSVSRWLGGSVSCVVLNTSQDDIGAASVVIVSYDLLARRAREFLAKGFQVVIMVSFFLLALG